MARATENLRFTRLKLRNWRNFRDAEMRLGARAFIVGPNASGKSNLLDAFRFLHDLASPTGGLAAAFRMHGRGGFSKVRCLEAKNPSDVLIEVDVGTQASPALWTYSLAMEKVGRGVDGQPGVLAERVLREGQEIEKHLREDQKGDPLLFSQTLLQQPSQNARFRELAAFFASTRYSHIVPQIVRDARRVPEDDDPFGGDLLRRINAVPEATRTRRLNKIKEALELAIPHLKSLELERDDAGRPHLLARYKFWRKPTVKQNEEDLSDGTLRLLGFLWAIQEGGGPLLLEEPELSLHDQVVAQLPRFIERAQRGSGRQIIATTHSLTMMDAPGVRPDEVHRIDVSRGWSAIETAGDNPGIVEKVVKGGWTIGQAVLPLTAPAGISDLAGMDVSTR